MRTTFLMLGAVALMLTACGRKTEPATPDPEPAPAIEPGPATTAAAPGDSAPETGATGVVQPSDPPPTLPEDPTGMTSPATTSPPQR